MGQHIGYIRVSTAEQNTGRQLQGIELDKVFEDRVSGKDTKRKQLQACLDYIREGDTLHVHSLDRLARSLHDLERLVSKLVNSGITVKFHKENMVFDQKNSNSMGKLLFQILGAFAEFERNMTRERQMEGIAKAKQEGRHLGRKPKLSKKQEQEVLDLIEQGHKKSEVARMYNIGRTSVYNIVKTARRL
mgnify:CR=1 FL=1